MLTDELTRAGFDVVCFKGVGATCHRPIESAHVVPFATNSNLREALAALPRRDEIGAVFHAAALCDFRVKSVRGQNGAELAAQKIPSRLGEITLTLELVPKLLDDLRGLFPMAKLVAWKYELNGEREDAIAAGRRQLDSVHCTACVVNGAAYGPGFGVCLPNDELIPCVDKARLCDYLVQWLKRASGQNTN